MVIFRKAYTRHGRNHMFTLHKEENSAHPYALEFDCMNTGTKINFKTKEEAEAFINKTVVPIAISEINCRKCDRILDDITRDGNIN